MPRIFLYEHLTATGNSQDPLYCEGLAMRDAIAADFRTNEDYEVAFFTSGTDEMAFQNECDVADFTLIIAPEFDGILARLTSIAERTSTYNLGSQHRGVVLCADKLALSQHWQMHGIPTPPTHRLADWLRDNYPAVFKPRFGAGSTATYLAKCAEDYENAAAEPWEMLVQPHVAGLSVSISLIISEAKISALMPSLQVISDDGRLKYLGGKIPLPAPLARRAESLAVRAVKCVPGLRGYVGVDLVLGFIESGSGDVAIEINPRLTTSYVGLRALAIDSIGDAILAAACHVNLPEFAWRNASVTFRPDGDVTVTESENFEQF